MFRVDITNRSRKYFATLDEAIDYAGSEVYLSACAAASAWTVLHTGASFSYGYGFNYVEITPEDLSDDLD